MANNIAIYNFKGGVGKTTTTFNLGSNWSRSFKVLLIDFDPQCNLTDSFIHDRPKETIYHYTKCLLHDQPARVQPVEIHPYLHLIPGDYQMVQIESNNQFITFGQEIIHRLLTQFQREYDMILMDCPTNFGVLVRSLLPNIDHILIPTQADSFSLSGVRTIVTYLTSIPAERIRILGILFNMYRRQVAQNKEAYDTAKTVLGDIILNTTISSSLKVREAIQHGKAVNEIDPDYQISREYRHLCDELLERLNENRTVKHLQGPFQSRLSA